MAHLGRPKGKVVPELSLAPVAARLGELLGANVPLAKDTYGEDAQAKVAAMNDGDVVLLENVRFNPEETSKDADERAAYAKKIAALGEAFVSDGFGVVHRAQAPTTTLPPICRPPQACWSRRKSRPCPRPPRTRSVRSPWCLAVPRSPTSSASSRTCSTRPTVWSSAVAWCSPSSRPRATRSAPPCLKRTSLRRSRATSRPPRRTALSSCCRPTSS